MLKNKTCLEIQLDVALVAFSFGGLLAIFLLIDPKGLSFAPGSMSDYTLNVIAVFWVAAMIALSTCLIHLIGKIRSHFARKHMSS